MTAISRLARQRSGLALVTGLLSAALFVGCNGTTAETAKERAMKDNPQFKKVQVAKFSGKVTIDGQPPTKDSKLFVILTDAQHLDQNARARAPKLYSGCDADGHFDFTTEEPKDGAPAGKYVVTFVELHAPGNASVPTGTGHFHGSIGKGVAKKYFGPDELKNQYNDPEKNAKEKEFNLDLQPPGKADYEFNLTVAGKEMAAAGPNAVTGISTAR